MFSRTALARLVGRFRIAPSLRLRGRAFSSPVARYSPNAAYYFRCRWWAGLEGAAYAPSTQARKRRRGLPAERVTLHDTGRMYGQTSLDWDGRDWVLRVRVEYWKYLRQRYGDIITQLTGDARKEFLGEVRNNIIKHYKQWRSSE